MKTNLKDCLEYLIDNRGVTPHKRGTEWQDKGVPVISANNVKTEGIKKTDEIRFVPEEVYSSWMKVPLEKGDIILTSEAPAGEVLYWDSDQKVILGQRLYGLKIKKTINSLFLKYYLQSEVGQKAVSSQQSGSTVFGISAATFSNITVYLPEKSAQDTAANLLYSLDKKIENNNAIAAELESIAKELYDYWFVQFDFPDKDGKPYKSSGGKMVHNEVLKRDIPEGWTAKALQEISKRVKVGFVGTVDKYYCNASEGFPIVRPAEMSINGIDYLNLRHITEEFYLANKKSQVHKGDIIISRCGKDGIPNLYETDDCAQVLNAIIIEPNIHIAPSEYLMELLHSDNIQKQITHKTSGSVQSVLNTTVLAEFQFPFEEKIAYAFHKKTRDIFNRITLARKESAELSKLRNFLLPMLMNGQVTVSTEPAKQETETTETDEMNSKRPVGRPPMEMPEVTQKDGFQSVADVMKNFGIKYDK